jgi:uncharacterized protein (DUF362 family)
MAKGAALKFTTYEETVPKLLGLVNLAKELPKHDKVVLKVSIKSDDPENPENTNVQFVEEVLKYCLQNKNPITEVFIAEGADGYDTLELFDSLGYRQIAEKYSIGLVDLNKTETDAVEMYKLLKFDKVMYPTILKESFIISLPSLAQSEECLVSASLSNMLGAYSARHYKGFFSKTQNKIRQWPIKYAIHDILMCKMPEFAIIDASSKGKIFAGIPLDMDKAAVKLMGISSTNVPYLSFIDETFTGKEEGENPLEPE